MRTILILFQAFLLMAVHAQTNIEISDMKWGADFNLHITFNNDSTTIHDIKALAHSNEYLGMSNEITYYPVALDPSFIASLKNKNIDSFNQENPIKNTPLNNNTLWSVLHPDIGGGYIHFVNSLIYAFESGKLNLTAPFMQRPETNWKPDPVTETYLRTKNWGYFVPDNQKLAHTEYKIQLKNNELGDIELLPANFVELFLKTNDKQFIALINDKQFNKVAIIEMIRLLLGSKYLGVEQINFIHNAVISAIMKYNINNLPSVVIFDDYKAAVAMTLNTEGYKIDKIVVSDSETLSEDALNQRIKQMEAVINEINEVNKKVFENRLKNYYAN